MGMPISHRLLDLQSGRAESLEVLRRRNEELEMELKKSREREERAREDVERMKERLWAMEEAEELLCFQLGEVEAESFEQARAYQREITALKEQLSHAH
ncbi:hypothetical protein ACLOJK_032165 [Asimina triloba]